MNGLWVCVVSLFVAFLSLSSVQAAGMKPETSVVILEESDGEASINVKNTESFPALLYSEILPIEGDNERLVVLTPPVARVESGESQAVRFLLQTKEPLKVQRLRRVIFESILPKNNSGKSQVVMNVRQNLPVIINPKGLPLDKEPWRHLKWSSTGEKLQVSNPSAYVVRLDQVIKLNAGNLALRLPRSYLLPGDVVTLDAPYEMLKAATAVVISPATVYGYLVDQYTAPLEP